MKHKERVWKSNIPNNNYNDSSIKNSSKVAAFLDYTIVNLEKNFHFF